MKKFIAIVSSLVSLLCLFEGCSKESPGPSGGLDNTRWIPVYAKGSLDAGDLSITWDGDIDQDGCLKATYMKDGAEIEYELIFDGYHFFKEKKKNLFSTFRLYTPGTESTPRGYYVKDDSLYLETLSTSGGASASAPEDPKPTGKYEAHIIKEFSADYLTFDGVTYKIVPAI